jgi:hypothetical protein
LLLLRDLAATPGPQAFSPGFFIGWLAPENPAA